MERWPPLGLISDASRVGEERFLEALEASVGAGLRMVQVREPGWERERLIALSLRVASLARSLAPGVLTLVNRCWEALPLEGIDGAHLGGGDPTVLRGARAALGPDLLLGYSAHSLQEAQEAERLGASYVSFSPVFGAISKRHPLRPRGLAELARVARALTIPVFALGGVEPRHALLLREAGASGASMIGGILDAADPAQAVRGFLSLWKG